jgi:hypothetical protein
MIILFFFYQYLLMIKYISNKFYPNPYAIILSLLRQKL